MSSATIQADVREKKGSRASQLLRAEGRIPATIQGGDGEHVDISLDSRAFWEARRHHVHLFDIEVGGETESATVRELQWDPMGEGICHIEFRRVQRGVKTDVDVALEFVGHPKSGVLNHLVNSVHIRCLPSDIPDFIEVRVDEMDFGHPLRAEDLVLPEGFELVTPGETQVAVVATARGLDEELETTEEGAEGEVPAPDASADAPEGTPAEDS